MMSNNSIMPAREAIAVYFEKHNFKRLANHQYPTDGICAKWSGKIACRGQHIGIIVALPEAFPDELPKIYLTKYFKHLPIPHVDDSRYICTFVRDQVNFYYEKPIGLVEDSIEKARKIIIDGVSGKNRDEFKDEFLAYWGDGENQPDVYALINTYEDISEVHLAIIDDDDRTKIKYIINDDDKKAIKSWVKKLNPELSIKKFEKCLFLSFKSVPIPPLPQNYKGIKKLLKNMHHGYEEKLSEFILDNGYEGFVLFSVEIGGEHVFGAWHHKKPKEGLLTKGYRPNKNKDVAKTRLLSQKIQRLCVHRVDSDRLQKRIGEKANSQMKTKKVCILGCGSIGSNIAFLMTKSGVEDLVLIDYDQIMPENISRHLCGMRDVKEMKVYAIAERLYAHFPHLKIKSYDKNFHGVLEENPNLFQDIDLIISATGNTAVERRLNQLQQSTDELPPVLYAWIEPYGLASHALIIIKGEGGCFDCCLNPATLNFAFNVGDFGRNATIREAGCQSTVTPYSALEADQASSIAARLALKYLNDQITRSIRYIWMGDLSLRDQLNFQLNPIYENVPMFSIQTYDIEKQKNCLLCSQYA